jgi:SAM-dependent methyltransferase
LAAAAGRTRIPGMSEFHESLRRIAERAQLRAWAPDMTDLPWGDPAFSERMLVEHLNQDHELASRKLDTIDRQVERLVAWTGVGDGDSVLDVTCGPGLFARAFARRGIAVTGVDIAPAAIRHARETTAGLGCTFIEADVRNVVLPDRAFDAAVYLYGQCEVARPDDLTAILGRIRAALRPGAPLAVEARVASAIARTTGLAWHTSTNGLFGPGVRLILTERGWDDVVRATVERHHILDTETGELDVIGATARALEPAELESILARAGFPAVEFHAGWDGLEFDDSTAWLVAVGR